MKRIFLLALVLCAVACKAQFPNTDSLHRYNNRWIRNSAVEAFSQLRLNTLLHGIIQHIDSAKLGEGGSLGIDTLYEINDSIIQYKKNNKYYTFKIKGVYDQRRKVDSAYTFNDSTLRIIINGSARDIVIRGNATGTTEYAESIGEGASVFKTKDGQTFRFRTLLSSDTSLIITENPDELNLVINPNKFSSLQRLADSIAGLRTIINNISLTRIPGKDSLFLTLNGIVKAVKDSTGGGGIDTLYAFNDSTVRYQKKGNTYSVNVRGKASVDTIYAANDSTIVYKKNGNTFSFLARGTAGGGGGGGGSQDFINITLSQLDVGIGLDTTKTYWITDKGKQGPFRNAGLVANQTTDDGALRVVDGNNRAWDRVRYGSVFLEWFGAVADAVFGGGNYATGTDNTPFLNNAIKSPNIKPFEEIVCPHNTKYSTVLDSIKGPIPIRVRFLGNTYQNGNDLFIITNASGGHEQHVIIHEGIAYDRINLPSHTKANYLAGTGPDWWSFTGSFVKIYNAFDNRIYFNSASGFRVPAEIIVSRDGDAGGAQQNVIEFNKFTQNNFGASLVNLRKGGYNDKNIWRGRRVSGNRAVNINGYADTAGITDNYVAANTSNEFHFLVEQVNMALYANADGRSNEFDFRSLETGTSTGIFSDTTIWCKTDGSNYMNQSKFNGTGWFEINNVSGPKNAFGRNAEINKPIRYQGDLLGMYARVNDVGRVLIAAIPKLGRAKRQTALSGTSNVSFMPDKDVQASEATNTTRYYSLPDSVGYLNQDYNTAANGFIYFDAPQNNVDRYVTINNRSDKAVSITLVPGYTTLPDSTITTFFAPAGLTWVVVSTYSRKTAVSSGGGGSANIVPQAVGSSPNANGFTYNSGNGNFNLEPADSTFPGVIKPGAQNLGSGKRLDSLLTRKIRLVNLSAGFTPIDIIRTQNGISFGGTSTANQTSSTLTAYEFPSGSNLKDAVLTIGKTTTNAGHVGVNSSDMFIVPEKSTGAVTFVNGISYTSFALNGGTLMAKLFGDGNLLLQRGGTAINAGYRLDVQGTTRFNGNIKIDGLGAGIPVLLGLDSEGNVITYPTSSGGGGGSSQWTGTSNIYFTGGVGIGINPGTFYSRLHLAGSTSTLSLIELGSTSVFPTTQRNHSLAYNSVAGLFRYMNGSGIPAYLMFENTPGTFTQASWNANDIAPAYIDADGSAKGDQLESNGTDGARFVKPRYELAYSQTSTVSITNTTTATSLFSGGAKTYTDYNLQVGDIVEIELNGIINNVNNTANSGIEWVLACNGYTYTFPAISNPEYSAVGKAMEHKVLITYTGTGTNTGARITWLRRVGNEPYTRMSFTTATGMNSVSPTFNLTGKWTAASASNIIDVYTGKIEFKRRPAP